MAAYDLTNKIFNKLHVDFVEGKDISRHNIWRCTCKCGNIVKARAGDLINEKITMCKDCKRKAYGVNNVIDSSKKNVDISSVKTEKITKFTYDNITDFCDENINLLSVPIIFKIVHTINADLTYAEERWNGEDTLAKNIDKFFKIREALDDLSSIDWNVGEVINTSIVYHLLTKNNRYDEVSYGNLQICLENLKRIASDNGDFYLAFPKICCGQDKLDWDIVKSLIEEVFGNTEFQIMLV